MGLALLSLPRKILVELFIILLTLLAYIAFPILFVTVLLPIYTFRFVVAKVSPVLCSELGKMLTALSSSFVVDIHSVYETPKNVILINTVLEGTVDIQRFRQSFATILELKDAKGVPLYPELKQSIVSSLGFFFWKNVQDFRVENHVKFYELNDKENSDISADNSREAVTLFSHNVISRPFQSGQSPWEFLVIPLSPPDAEKHGKTLVFLRSHHALADGYSLFQLVLKHADIKEAKQSKPNFTRPKPTMAESLGRTLRAVAFPFLLPYDVISQFIRSYDVNRWHIPEKSMARDSCGIICENFPIQAIKDTKKVHGTSFAAVLLAGFAGGMRKTMMQLNITVPSSIHCLTPMPLPGHTEKLRNYMTGCFVELPLDIADPIQRLKAINRNMNKIKHSTLLHANYLLHRLVGALFSFIMKIVWKPVLCTATMSCFPGFNEETYYLGHRIIHTGFVGHVGVGNIGVLMTVFSYNGNLEMCLSADKNVIKSIKGEKALMDNMLRDLHSLCCEQVV